MDVEASTRTVTHAEQTVTSARWAVWAFVILIALTPATPHIAIGSTPLSVDDLTTLAAAVVGVVAAVRCRGWRMVTFRTAPEVFFLALLVPFTGLAAVHAGSLHSLGSGPARWLLVTVLVGSAYILLRDPADGQRMIRAIVLVAAFEAAFGLVAYLFDWSAGNGLLGMAPTARNIGGFHINGRITGTTMMAPTFVAGLLGLALPAAVGIVLAAKGMAKVRWLAVATVIGLGLLFTLSRMPIGLAGLAVAVLLLSTTRPRVWIPIGVGAIIAFLAIPPLRDRMTNFDAGRMDVWYAGWRMFLDHPLLGVGPGQYMDYFAAYADTPYGVAKATPHNSILYVAAESGILAAIAIAVAIALTLRFLRSRNPLILGPMLGSVVFMIDGMTTNLYCIPSIAIAAWMIAPSVAPMFRMRRTSAGDEPGAPTGAQRTPSAESV